VRLRPDLVLVKLPPAKVKPRVEIIANLDTFLSQKGIEEFQRLVKVPTVEQPVGTVVQVGRQTHDVWPGDVVLLEPEAGQPVDIIEERTGLPWPHLIVRERDISAVIERSASV